MYSMIKKVLLLFVLTFGLGLNIISAKGKFTLVIDPGHGGRDAGAIGAISKEKDINLNVALAFGRLVEHNLSDVNVVYTRKTDVFIPLKGRAEIANKEKADLFVSVHTNSVPPGRSPRGFQVYTLGMHRAKDNLDVAIRENGVISLEQGYQQTYEGFNPNSSESYIMFEFMQNANMEKSVQLAQLIQHSVCSKANRIDKGVHQAGFLVLRETSMPGCLIELGFITAEEEEQFLNTEEGIDLMARGIYEAFVEYKNKVDDHLVIPYKGNYPQQVPKVTTVTKIEPKTIDDVKIAPKVNVAVSQPTQIKKEKEVKAIKEKKTNIQASTQSKKKEQAPVSRNVKSEKKTTVAAKKPEEKKNNNTSGNEIRPIFKVQIFAINRQLRPGSEHFKGHNDVDSFQEGNVYKYTIGASEDYNEVVRLRQKLKKDFPEAFIIAFKNGERMNTSVAVGEFAKRIQKIK